MGVRRAFKVSWLAVVACLVNILTESAVFGRYLLSVSTSIYHNHFLPFKNNLGLALTDGRKNLELKDADKS